MTSAWENQIWSCYCKPPLNLLTVTDITDVSFSGFVLIIEGLRLRLELIFSTCIMGYTRHFLYMKWLVARATAKWHCKQRSVATDADDSILYPWLPVRRRGKRRCFVNAGADPERCTGWAAEGLWPVSSGEAGKMLSTPESEQRVKWEQQCPKRQLADMAAAARARPSSPPPRQT